MSAGSDPGSAWSLGPAACWEQRAGGRPGGDRGGERFAATTTSLGCRPARSSGAAGLRGSALADGRSLGRRGARRPDGRRRPAGGDRGALERSELSRPSRPAGARPGSWRFALGSLARPYRYSRATLLAGVLPDGPMSTEPIRDTVRSACPRGWAPHPGRGRQRAIAILDDQGGRGSPARSSGLTAARAGTKPARSMRVVVSTR